MGGLLGGLGTRQIYTQQTVDAGPLARAQELVTGFAYMAGGPLPAWTPEDPTPTLAVMVGANPPVSGGYLGAMGSNWAKRVRTFRNRGGELWVIDPRETKSARLADRHLAPRPGSDVFLFGWLVRELLEDGFDAEELQTACAPADVELLRGTVASFELEAVAERTGLAARDLLDLLAAIRRHKKVAILPATGVSFQASGVLAYWLIWAVQIVTGSLDREGGMRFFPSSRAMLEPDAPPMEGHAPTDGNYLPGPTSRPDLAGLFGQLPTAALVDEIEAGEVRALLLLGSDPIGSAPNPERMRAALAKLEVLAVADIFDNELTELATHVLACTWFIERHEFKYFPTFGGRRAFVSPPVVPPAAERRYGWWVVAQIGRRLGIDVLPGLDPDIVDDGIVTRHVAHAWCDHADEVLDAGVDGIEVESRYGWYHEKVLPGGRWRLAPQVLIDRVAALWEDDCNGLRLVAGRTLGSVNVAHYAPEGPPPFHVSADAAHEHAIATGDRIRVSTAYGAIEGRAEVDDTLAPQTIWVTHGWLKQNVNQLTDPTIDRLTGQPVFTGFPVQLEHADAPTPVAS
jgi:anaerobic selenocysteine-containing dehydrogenase